MIRKSLQKLTFNLRLLSFLMYAMKNSTEIKVAQRPLAPTAIHCSKSVGSSYYFPSKSEF
jgi:hypothetical protein